MFAKFIYLFILRSSQLCGCLLALVCRYLLLKTHQLPLDAFLVALSMMQVEDVDIDEVQCILANLIYMVRTHTHTHRCVYQPRLSCVFSLFLRVTSRVTSPTSTRNLWSVNRTHSLHSPLSLRLHYPQPPPQL